MGQRIYHFAVGFQASGNLGGFSSGALGKTPAVAQFDHVRAAPHPGGDGSDQGRLSKGELRQVERGEEALREALATLLRREIIEADGDGYRVTVPLVAEYAWRERPRLAE